jgi:hypothetical protein
LTVAAVQAAYVLMDREATLAKVETLLADPAVQWADLSRMGGALMVALAAEARRRPARV